jgi:hypothetical protein
MSSHNSSPISWPVCPLSGQNNLKNILFFNPVADLWDRMSSSQNVELTVFPWGMGALTCFSVFRFPDPTSSTSETNTQFLLVRGSMTSLSASCWQWGKGGGRVGVVVLISGVDLCGFQRPPIELDGRLMHRQRYCSRSPDPYIVPEGPRISYSYLLFVMCFLNCQAMSLTTQIFYYKSNILCLGKGMFHPFQQLIGQVCIYFEARLMRMNLLVL